ncbi:unnamed protein product [Ostreobium quekettii]|uniref:Uncharacterized protein n=1 Tax=Ostreobium quekettii TaxID=121088 RepID=A0A8S1JCI3_9CHLO|nr:unnamed protein product [Ostreobium quekettii]|eukprot:evm.model.scf_195.3 EVM.evm.TU.scf_195.3   scf_195:19688-21640(-)
MDPSSAPPSDMTTRRAACLQGAEHDGRRKRVTEGGEEPQAKRKSLLDREDNGLNAVSRSASSTGRQPSARKFRIVRRKAVGDYFKEQGIDIQVIKVHLKGIGLCRTERLGGQKRIRLRTSRTHKGVERNVSYVTLLANVLLNDLADEDDCWDDFAHSLLRVDKDKASWGAWLRELWIAIGYS